MTDIVDKATRSKMMSGIRGKDTKPEMVVRRGLHRRGFRYTLHSRKVLGRPDIVLPKYNAIILVHGCFWHGHDCHLFKWPGGERADFWREKITSNKRRDLALLEHYAIEGWNVAVIWECSLKGRTRISEDVVLEQLHNWLNSGRPDIEIRGQ